MGIHSEIMIRDAKSGRYGRYNDDKEDINDDKEDNNDEKDDKEDDDNTFLHLGAARRR